MMRFILILLNLLTASASRRRDAIVDLSVQIPAYAHQTYCTAIMGYYDKCTRLNSDALTTATMCDGAKYTPLEKPLFIDLVNCYANPNFADGNSVTFFGETPDTHKILEFHMIFHEGSSSDNLKPTNCQPNGSCVCPADLLALKKQFLAAGGCENTADYSCLSEDWYGDTETCFTPATDMTVGNEFRCAMTAVVQQYGPCDVVLDIPDSAKETYCTGITGWYDDCELPPDENSEECTGNFFPLDDPLWLNLESCYSNPHMSMNAQSYFGAVSFYGKVADGTIREFHMIFKTADSAFLPSKCDSTGLCQCSPAMNDLKKKFLADGDCQSSNYYFCMSEPFFGVTAHCFVPATSFLPTGKLACSMTARIEQIEPCDRDIPSSSVMAPTPAPTPYPTLAPTPYPIKPVVIPAAAHPAYCTAIMGYYDKCTRLNSDALTTATMCDGAKYTPLEKPLFIDLVNCYANPNFADGNSVTFFGETPDTHKILEFHMIFHEGSSSDNLKPTKCQPNGSCVCPADLLALKKQFLAAGGCENTADYSCLSEDWYGDTETCFTPATDMTVGNEFRCAMTAVVQQYGPCDVVLDIPDSAKETYCTGITGWYDDCELPSDENSDECTGNFFPLDDPLWVDLESCYSNPHMSMNAQSYFGAVSFYGKVADGTIREFHMIFLTEASEYLPTNCKSTGACLCSPALNDLKQKFLADGDCQATSDYYCMSETFFGVTEHCFVPATSFLPTGKLACSMTARIEQMDACDDVVPTSSVSIPIHAPTSPTSWPIPALVPPPTPSSLPPVPSPPALPSPNDHSRESPQLSDDGSVVIPSIAHPAFCTAIMGWYDGCIFPDNADDPDETMCAEARYYPLAEPEFINLSKCYQNPRIPKHSISFFGETPDRKKVMEFHLVFKKPMDSPYLPSLCNTMGVCECPPAILKLKKQFLAAGKCTNTETYSCTGEDFWGVTDECFVPASDIAGSQGIACSMVAKLQQFGPCDVVLDIPPAAYDTYCTAITGWYSECLNVEGAYQTMCPAGSFNALAKPLFIDLGTCYRNPMSSGNSVSFYSKDDNGLVTEYNMLFNDGKGEHLIPTNCNLDGACQCPPALVALKKSFMASGGCSETPEYVCRSAPFFGDNDRCYVPLAATFNGNKFICAMSAKVEAFEPCDKSAITEKEYRMSMSGAEAWLISVLVILVVLCTCFVAYVRLIPVYRRRQALARRAKAQAEEDAEDDVINVAWGGRAYKDDPDGDGVYNEGPTRELELNGRKFKGEKFFTVNVIS